MTTLLIAIAALLTSTLSGIVGMAGGMVLMAVLVLMVSVPAAMVLHGAIQGVANGSRGWFLREHIVWKVMPPFLLGSAIGVAGFVALALSPSQNMVLLMVGLFPWIARASRVLRGLDITKRGTAFAAGLISTPIQLLVGVSGPLQDVFFLNADLNRQQVVATKAISQTIGHGLKIAYYGAALSTTTGEISIVRVALALTAALMGTRAGTLILARLSDDHFKRITEWVILSLGSVCAVKGAWGYASAWFA